MKQSNSTTMRKSDVSEFEHLRNRYLEELEELRSRYGALFVALIQEVTTNDTIAKAHH